MQLDLEEFDIDVWRAFFSVCNRYRLSKFPLPNQIDSAFKPLFATVSFIYSLNIFWASVSVFKTKVIAGSYLPTPFKKSLKKSLIAIYNKNSFLQYKKIAIVLYNDIFFIELKAKQSTHYLECVMPDVLMQGEWAIWFEDNKDS